MATEHAPPAASTSAPPSLKPINKAGHYGNLDDNQKKLLMELETKLTEAGALPSPILEDEEQRTTVLLRYLRAREWSVEAGTKMYLDAQKWRKDVDLAGMMKDAQDGKDIFEERKRVADAGWKMYFHGTDRYNRPIFYQDLSYLKVDQLFKETTSDRIINFFAFMLEDAVRHKYAACTKIARQQAKEAGESDAEALKKIVIDDNYMILNIAGLGMGTFWAFKGQLQQLLGILDANFPDMSGRIQIINAPWLFSTIWSYIKGWLPLGTVAKIGISGADFQKDLFEYVDPKELPVDIGGTCQCSHENGCVFSDKGPWSKH
ncbi:hypothetical protein CBS101457_002493 [Exobasidium rhododendri]|nr:hypothetical protein CBS101457_002493 [Exobasidium rhododendri]